MGIGYHLDDVEETLLKQKYYEENATKCDINDKPTVIIEETPVFEPIQNGLAGFKTVIHIINLPDIPYDIETREKIIALFEKETKRILKYLGIIKESNNDKT